MRPRNLRIEGFTCFADKVDIDFRGMDVFVISGPTGAGKTTLIDAICYALYGRIARDAGKKNISGLIAHNRDQMRVGLEFEAAGRVYRVSRGFNVTRKSARDGTEKVTRTPSPVQFEQLIGEAWDPMHDRVKDIDAAVEEIVGLDFDAFTRCVLLPQGQFQEFLTGDAKDRRAILIDLLDLGIYDRTRAAANARATEHANETKAIETRLREDYADATDEALAAARERVAASGPALAAAQAERDALNSGVALAQAVMSARKRQRARSDDHAVKLKEIDAAEGLSRDGETQLGELSDLLKAASAELEAIAYDGALHDALRQSLLLAKRVSAVATEHAKAIEVAADASSVDAAKTAAAAADTARAKAASAVAEAEHVLEAARRDDAAAHLQQALKPGDPCPVCGGTVGKLAKAGKSRVAEAAKTYDAARKAEHTATSNATKAAQALASEQQRHASAAEQASQRARDLEQARAELAGALPKGIKPDEAAIKAKLDEQETARKALDDLTRNRDAVRKQHDELAEKISGAAKRIEALRGEAKSIAAEVDAAQREGDEQKARLIELASKRNWSDAGKLIDAKKDPVPALESMRERCNAEVDRLNRDLTRAESDEKRIVDGIAKAGDLRKRRDEHAAGGAIYGELANVLRANNFQQFVLDEAMHVLAESATQHLQTLYPRFQVEAEKSDFVVVDTWQAGNRRSARTLSGGETFVASLALALALSERLPQLQSNASAVLESLFLDEGFGTLDRETLDTVIGALEGLRSQERMVGIITHVPELAQRIETKIEVTKAREGSTVSVVGV